MTTLGRSVGRSSGSLPTLIGARPARVARYARSWVPSRSAIMPPGTASSIGMPLASPGRLSTTTMPTPPAARTRLAFRANVQSPRDTSAIAPRSEPAGSGVRPPSRLPGGPQSLRGTGRAVDTDDRPDVDELLVARPPAVRRRRPVRPEERDSGQARRRIGRRQAKSRREDLGVRERRDGDRVRCGTGRAGRAEAVLVAVVAGRDDGHDAGRGDVADGLDHRVALRIGLRTSAREVDDVHAVADGGLEGSDDLGGVADVPDGCRHVEDTVVPDLRSRGDAVEA